MSRTNFQRALILVAQVFLPIAALAALGLVALHFLYLQYPARTDLMRNLVVDYSMVQAQADRIASRPAADIAFLGDSSCLMGIDPPHISKLLNRSVESFCTIAFAGPTGHAAMLEQMIERGTSPKMLILMFHPVAFRPIEAWNVWVDLVKNKGQLNAQPLDFPRSALDFLAFELVTRLLYSPLPGGYGIYYGSESEVRSTIEAKHGAAVDPANGLNVSSIGPLRAARPAIASSGPETDFSLNPLYRDGLATLAAALKKLPHSTKVYLVISPVADASFPLSSETKRDASVKEIANSLEIPPEHILCTPSTMHFAYFTNPAHLNRWGQAAFTEDLIRTVKAAGVEP